MLYSISLFSRSLYPQEIYPEEITSAYKQACAEGQAPHYQGSIMAVGKSAAGKTSFKKRLTGEEIDEDHLVTNALETDLCTIDIANVSLAWEIHAKQRTDLLEDEITLKIKDFVRGQDVRKSVNKKGHNGNIDLTPVGNQPLLLQPTRKKNPFGLVGFFSRLRGKKKKDVNNNTAGRERSSINEERHKRGNSRSFNI